MYSAYYLSGVWWCPPFETKMALSELMSRTPARFPALVYDQKISPTKIVSDKTSLPNNTFSKQKYFRPKKFLINLIVCDIIVIYLVLEVLKMKTTKKGSQLMV